MTAENHVLRAVRSEASQRYLIRAASRYEGGGLVALEASNVAQRDKTVTQRRSRIASYLNFCELRTSREQVL